MGINLDPAELDMARLLAARQGLTLDGAVRAALLRDLERHGWAEDLARTPEERERQRRDTLSVIQRVQEDIAALPELDPRPYREILYDEDGLPR